jgi:hypothetical protein
MTSTVFLEEPCDGFAMSALACRLDKKVRINRVLVAAMVINFFIGLGFWYS